MGSEMCIRDRPYTLDVNDMRFATPQGFNSGDQFYTYMKDSFDQLYAEGAECPKMMSVGLHCRLAGRRAGLLRWRVFWITFSNTTTFGLQRVVILHSTGVASGRQQKVEARLMHRGN